jgi:hypothetical protein
MFRHPCTCFEFAILVTSIYPSTWLRVVSPSTLLRTVSLSNGLSNHLKFDFWCLACDEPFGCELRVERLSRVEFS